jgi:hypothetical protein
MLAVEVGQLLLVERHKELVVMVVAEAEIKAL